MSECNFQLLLGAYHDRELDAAVDRRIARHVGECFSCATALRGMRELSARITTAAAMELEADAAVIAGMHRAVDRAARDESAAVDRPLLRMAGLLSALAASVLIISGVWLLDSRGDARLANGAGAAAPRGGDVTAITPDWERVAITLRAQPRPGIGDDSPFAPRYAEAIHWMLDGLIPAGGRSEGKPWAEPKSF
ncbi:MAG: hypothetical protein JWN40_5099 [Phycisphaerales bacterium]|nr:hypothetical protein [Phycisphaerales bacterium]